MMKRLFILLLVFSSLTACGQTVTQYIGTKTNTVLTQGSHRVDSLLYLPQIASRVPTWPGALRYNPTTQKLQLYTSAWGDIASGSSSGTDSAAYHTVTMLPDSTGYTINRPDGTKDTIVFTGEEVAYATQSALEDTAAAIRADMGTGGSSATSGLYNPTGTAVASITELSVSQDAIYTRIGDIVTVTAQVTVTPTATGGNEFAITLPVVSNFVADRDLMGIATSSTGVDPAYVRADITNDRARITLAATSGESRTYNIQFSYRVL